MHPENQFGNRRSFIRKSAASGFAIGMPTFFNGLIRARGDEGGSTTSDPWETQVTTSPENWETTIPDTTDEWETTVPDTTVQTTVAVRHDIVLREGKAWDGANLRQEPAWAGDYYESASPSPSLAFAGGFGQMSMKLRIYFDPETLEMADGRHVLDASIRFRAAAVGTFRRNGAPDNMASMTISTAQLRFRAVCDEATGVLTTSLLENAPAFGDGNSPMNGEFNTSIYNDASGTQYVIKIEFEEIGVTPKDGGKCATLSGVCRLGFYTINVENNGALQLVNNSSKIEKSFEFTIGSHSHP